MNKEKVIYQLSVEDIFTVIEDNELKIKIKEKDIPFIEDKVGDFMGDKWNDAIRYALFELQDSKKKIKRK